jgi:tRNA uridine 5-carboxymethylaminomethyl modification enzyme
VGPRYCPSIEDKITRFAERSAHQIFIEPEGLETHEVYPNGISTSLPYDVQCDLVHSIRGLEKAHVTRAGYAIEYDFFDPRDLKSTLETKLLNALFFAGQINGTTGYEEAAAQGLLAGINAACLALEREPWAPSRSEAYLGVLVDDLITLGTKEPYRMFTSRSEYRLTLREDNADLRLTPIARKLGLVSDQHWRMFEEKQEAIEREKQHLRTLFIRPNTPAANQLENHLQQPLEKEVRVLDLLRRPEANYDLLLKIDELGLSTREIDPLVAEQIEVQIKYAGYIEAQEKEIARAEKYGSLRLPIAFDYSQISGLSRELQEKLNRFQPETLSQATRIPGMTPAAISLLLVYLKTNHK